MPTVTLQPVADTYVSASNPNSNYGGYSEIEVNDTTSGGGYMGLMKFDLSSIPVGSKVTEARITTTTTRSDVPYNVFNSIFGYPCTSAWTESGATWSSRPSVDTSTSSSVSTGSSNQYDIRVTQSYNFIQLAKYWIEQGKPNHGFTIQYGITDYNPTWIASKSHSTASWRPSLTITYDVPLSAPVPTTGLTFPLSIPEVDISFHSMAFDAVDRNGNTSDQQVSLLKSPIIGKLDKYEVQYQQTALNVYNYNAAGAWYTAYQGKDTSFVHEATGYGHFFYRVRVFDMNGNASDWTYAPGYQTVNAY